MKTIREHFQAIEHPVIRERALANMWWEDAGTPVADLPAALYQGFNFFRSPEGMDYWACVYGAAQEGEPMDHFLKLKNLAE